LIAPLESTCRTM